MKAKKKRRSNRVASNVLLCATWSYRMGYVTDKRYHRLYRDDKHGLQMELITRRRNGMPAGKGRKYFFMDGDKREFTTETGLMRAWFKAHSNRG